MTSFKTSKLLGAAMIATTAASANATVVHTLNTEAASGAGSSPSIAVTSGDLLETSLALATGTARYPGDGSGSEGPVNASVLTDGSWGDWNSITTSVGFQDPNTIYFELDTSVNTLGYDITSIVMSAWWSTGGNGRSEHRYAIGFGYVDDGALKPLTPMTHYTPGGPVEATQVTLTNDGGGVLDNGTYSLTGVDRIHFSFGDNDNTVGGGAGGNNPWNFLREIDIIGTATVPEPSSLALIALGGIAMLRRRRS